MSPLIPLANILSRAVAPGREEMWGLLDAINAGPTVESRFGFARSRAVAPGRGGLDGRIAQGPG